MNFINFTPHAITLNDGRVFESIGVARVGNTFSDFDSDGVCSVAYGDIEGLPAPQDDTLYIVSALVLSAAKAVGRTDCVAPATGHPACVRDKGFIVSVPGFVRQAHGLSGVCVFSWQQNKHTRDQVRVVVGRIHTRARNDRQPHGS